MRGAGIVKALSGIDAVVHAATTARRSFSARADIKATRRLLEAARHANVKHFVYVSISGIDGVPYPYYRTKVACEALVAESDLPWSILRATQFHDLIEIFLDRFSRVPGIVAAPLRWQFQPVDADEVAARLVDVALAPPAGRVPDFGGPEVRDLESLARAWVNARRMRRRIVDLPLPFAFSRQFAEGALLVPEQKSGKITFEQHLAHRYPRA